MIDEVGGGFDHPPGAAGGAKSSAFAGKINQMFVSAAVALDP